VTNSIKQVVVLVMLILLEQQGFAQAGNKGKFTFPDQIKKIEIPQEFKKFNAVILEEQLSYARTNSGISRHVRIKIQNNKGLEEYRKICLPESPDNAESIFLVPRYKAETIHYPLGAPDMIIYFAARIIKPDGSVKIISPRDSSIKYTWNEKGEKKSFYNFYYIFDELKVGDEIDIYYSHREIYYQSSTYNQAFNTWEPYRIFFNSTIPKVQYDLNLKSTVQNAVKFTFENNAEPLDTSFEKNGNFKDIVLHWHFENLAAVNNIWSSHLYKDLPHVKFYDAGDLIAKDSKNEALGVLEYPWSYSLRKFVGMKLKYDGYDRHFSSITAYNNLYREVLATSKDTTKINQINFFHEHINHDFKFLNDVEYISGDDIFNPRIGKFIESKQLRRIGRFNLYEEVIDRFDIPYYLVAIADKRIDEINFNKFNFGFGVPGIYCIIHKGAPYFVQPKNHQFGHHMNELPFYYEGCPIILIPQREPEQRIINLGIAYLPELIYINTPSSNESENTRKVMSMVNVNLNEQKVEFNTKLSLTGQFSTLTRGFYTSEYIDSSINKQYYRKVYQLSPKSKLIEMTKTSEDSIFPFKTNFQMKYADAGLLTKKNDSVFVFKLTEFMQHVLEQNIDTNAFNSFYPDFKQTDVYRYFVKFNHPVKLQEPNLNITIDNSLGKYVFSVSQKSETDIMVESYLQISSDKVTQYKLKDVYTIGELVQKNKSAEITLIAQMQ